MQVIQRESVTSISSFLNRRSRGLFTHLVQEGRESRMDVLDKHYDKRSGQVNME